MARETCVPWGTETCLPSVFWAEICLLAAGTGTFSLAGTLTSAWAGSASSAGF